MKTIFLTIIRGSLVRNFFHTGVVAALLEKGIRVVIITQNPHNREIFGGFSHPNLFFEHLDTRPKRFQRIFEELYKGAVFNRTVHFMYRYRFAGAMVPSAYSLTVLYMLRMLFLVPLRYLPGAKALVRFADFVVHPERQHEYLFEKYKPDVVFNTSSRGDYGVLKSAKRHGIPTIDMPKSWDNPSKVLFNVKADRMIVWSPFMKEQIVRLQGYKPHEVIVTGVPQFDFYARKEGLISREEFCGKFGLNPSKKIILFSSTGGDLCDEAHYVECIRYFIDEGKLQPANVLIRPHVGYKNDAERYARLKGVPYIAIDYTDKQQSEAFKDNWDTSLAHVHNLMNSLHHADVLVNITSTMTLDALAAGTPVINLKFDTRRGLSRHFSTRRLYKTDYGDAVTSAGGTWVVESEREYLSALQDILEKGQTKEQERQKMAAYFMYKNDGMSAERITITLLHFLGGSEGGVMSTDAKGKNPSRYSIKELRDICQGSVKKHNQSYFGRLTRIFSIYFTAVFLRTKITPNQITTLGSVVFFLGALFYFGNRQIALLGPVFYFLSIVIDGADGEVARFRETKGAMGSSYVEPVSHDIQYGLFFFILGVALWVNGFSASMIIVGSLASISKVLFRSIRMRYWHARYGGTERGTRETQQQIFESKTTPMLMYHYFDKNICGYPGILVPLAVATIFYRLDIFLYFYAIIFFSVFMLLVARHIRAISNLK